MVATLKAGGGAVNSKQNNSSGPKPAHVRRVYVKRLFGHFTYDLSVKGSDFSPRLLILYGDNGSGKTTLLQMVFHLLHPARRGGHRTFLARSIFEKFEVELANGSLITAERLNNNLVGTFHNAIHTSDGTTQSVEWPVDQDGSVKGGAKEGEEAELAFLNSLKAVNVDLYFLTDDRRIASTRDEEGPQDVTIGFRDAAGLVVHVEEQWFLERQLRDRMADPRGFMLEDAISRASNWVTQQVIAASSKGEEDANAIYTRIVQRLARLTVPGAEKKARPSKGKLIEALRKQASRSAAFARYGLIAPAGIDALIESIQQAPANALIAIQDVIKPYTNGLEVRLDALKSVHDRVDSFVSILNGFYTNNTVNFGLKSGLAVLGPNGESLPARALSSGEKQLLLLFCNLLTARGQDAIFMIDEPELSLNVKWQRQLTRTLLGFTAGTRTQFMLATHSIELLSRHRDCVLKLADSANN